MWDHRPAAAEHAAEVHLDRLVPRVGGHLGHGCAGEDARGVDQDIDPALGGDNRVSGRLDIGVRSHVDDPAVRAFGQSLQDLWVAIPDGDGRAVLTQPAHDGCTDVAAAGHDRDPIR